ncbi:MAG TPA: patatin family protein [Candidatus Eubacterium avistercoris]|uniref:Patatin family protein n=1 Tax=Candidatus Eubacterium avistercoris TaxID=2838567 RepID=A0A9D2IHG6_9FIRM|nr:patatin family protein [Candidatus Eubacterium avistercoris]
MENPEKIGLVVEGGGMKCAYNAGILDAFIDYGISFDYCIGVSGGAGNAASFVAGQRGRNLRFYTEHIHSPRFFGLRSLLRSGDLFGLKYIYGELTNSTGKDPLDYPAMMESATQYQLAVTNAATGQPEYFGKEDMKQDDYRLIMASCAIPVACHPVEINGQFYFDGGLVDAVPVRHALEEGCSRLVVLLTKSRGYVKAPQNMRWLYSRLRRKYPKIVSAIDQRHVTYNENLKKVYELEREGKAFVFAPSQSVKAGTYSMKEEQERALYELGMEDFKARYENLKKFLKTAES